MFNGELESDVVIVGSGVGGATVAKQLAIRGKKCLIIEKGRYFPLQKIGTIPKAYKFYDRSGVWSRTKEGVFYYRAIMAGGTSIVSCGNGVRSLENEFRNLGLDLTEAFLETEKELGIKPVPNSHIGRGTRVIMEAATKLGFNMAPMPKYIDFKRCVSCGNCVVGCYPDAKWTALRYLKEAQDQGAGINTGINITKVIISNGRAIGVEGRNHIGRKIKILANKVILSAGAIETPVILQNSGVEAGQKLFLDLFIVTIGITKDMGMTKELTMAAVSHNDGFILSPFMDNWLSLASTISVRDIPKIVHLKRMLGIMTKINDDLNGRVYKNCAVEKRVTASDLAKLNKGYEISREILIKAGADPKSIIKTKIRGAHPGGTTAIGEVVDKNLETRIKGLFVCDASVLPRSPGLPPIVTIIALAKKIFKNNS